MQGKPRTWFVPVGTLEYQNGTIAINANRMPEGLGFAMQKVLRKAALSLDDMSVIEINEAFAVVILV